jgi:hypothetical protein
MDDDLEAGEYSRKIVYLGGKISGIDKDYLDIAKLDPHSAIAKFFFMNLDKFGKQTAKDNLLMILEYIGKVKKANRFTEITVLSMILGDISKRWDAGKDVGDATH